VSFPKTALNPLAAQAANGACGVILSGLSANKNILNFQEFRKDKDGYTGRFASRQDSFLHFSYCLYIFP
jgi:hypothetical protein